MKRLMKLMVVVAVAISPFLTGASASAQSGTCEIGYTGPNSENQCTMTYKCSVTQTNTNTVTISDQTNQEVASGSVGVTGNTGGGNATSGTVTNTSGTVFNVTITNPTPDTKECVATTTVPATNPETPKPTPTPTPTTSGGGQVMGMTLPAASTDNSETIFALVTGAFLLAISLGVSGVLWYRQHKML